VIDANIMEKLASGNVCKAAVERNCDCVARSFGLTKCRLSGLNGPALGQGVPDRSALSGIGSTAGIMPIQINNAKRVVPHIGVKI